MTASTTARADNAHVRSFARAHGLRTCVADDGQVQIRCGPRGSANSATFGARPGLWTLYVQAPHPGATRGLSYLKAKLHGAGALRVTRLDFELVAEVAESEFLRVADASEWTRPQRRRRERPEVVSARSARLGPYRYAQSASQVGTEHPRASRFAKRGSTPETSPPAPSASPGETAVSRWGRP